MIKSHNLGYPRIGNKRETKFALEKYWRNEITLEQLLSGAEKLRLKNWSQQKDLDLIPVGDFSFYDHILDNSFLFGHIPKKVNHPNLTYWEKYFLVARGKSPTTEFTCKASEMTKWFDTNYHYIVPELENETQFNLNPEQLLKQISEIKTLGLNAKVVLTGPLTYLWLCKEKSEKKKLDFLDDLLEEYSKLLEILKNENVKWVQFDEPILGLDLESNWLKQFNYTYKKLNHSKLNTMVATYFGKLNDNLDTLLNLPVKVVHLDITNQLSETNELLSIANKLPKNTELSIGLLDGRNIWKNNLEESYQKLKFLSPLLKKTIWIAPNCSLLHVPIELNNENKLPNEIKNWFSFANEKLEELRYLKEAFIDRVQNKDYLDHINDYKKRNSSKIINDLIIILVTT